jgi:hypothetical protein
MRIATLALALALGCGSEKSGVVDGGGDGVAIDSTSPDAPIGAGTRRFGVEVDEPMGFDHGVELAKAKAIGSSAVQITFPWKTLEPTAGQRDLAFLQFAMGYYRDRGVSVLLSVPTIDTVEKMFPADLMSLAMDDAQVVARLNSLFDDILAFSGAELTHLVIGNEVNIYLGPRPATDWTQYTNLITAAANHLEAARPAIEVGISVSYGGLPDTRFAALTAATDVRYVTYYFIGNEFGGSPATNLDADFAKMLDYAGDQPLVLKELGYPTGPATGGSDAGQREFITKAFEVWDDHAARVPLVMFSMMFDRSRTYCEETAAYYGFPGDEAFIQFLCTLGLRTFEDLPKPAWTELAAQSSVRGF